MAKEQALISDLTKDFQGGMDKLSSASDGQRVLATQLDAALKTGVEKLKGSCMVLRDKLEHLGDIRAACQHAQTDAAAGLPTLFAARAKDPERFARFGQIHGCAAPDDGATAVAPGESTCACSGTEELGCQDARDISDHELICSRIVDKKIKEIEALDAFKPGGVCRLDGQEEVTKALMPLKDFAQVRQVMTASMMEPSTLVASVLSRDQCERTWQNVKAAKQGCRTQKGLSDFLFA